MPQRSRGLSSYHTVPEPPQPHDKIRERERLVCEGGTGAQLSGLAYAQLFSSDIVY